MRSAASLLLAIIVLGAGAGCATPASPTTPSGVTAPTGSNFEGVWVVKFTLEGCSGYRHCVLFRGQTRTLGLRLMRSGTGYEGVLSINADHVTVRSVEEVQGRITLSGSRPAPGRAARDIAVEDVSFEFDANGAANGKVRYIERGEWGSDFFGTAITSGTITSMERSGSLESFRTFAGQWKGWTGITGCDHSGWTHCYPMRQDDVAPISVTLTQSGTVLTGTLDISGTSIPVTGQLNGDSLTLTGSARPPASGVQTLIEVRGESVRADRLGRLIGTLSIDFEWTWNDPSMGVYRVHYPAFDLALVAKVN